MARDYSTMSDSELKDLAAQNSEGWRAAGTQEAKDWLHEQNEIINKELDSRSGSTSTFDSTSGTWSTSPAAVDDDSSDDDGGYVPLSGGGDSGGSAYKPYQGGVYSALDETMKSKGSEYTAARDRGDWRAMREIGDSVNQELNRYGFAALDLSPEIKQIYDQYAGTSDVGGGGSGVYAAPSQQISQGQQYDITADPGYQSMAKQLEALQAQLAASRQQANDYSDLVKQLQDAAREKAKAELAAAYEKNVNAIDAAQGQIAPKYTDARNQAAGQAAVNQRNWQEQASAMGLNSGAAGQSDLARGVALQNDLARLGRAETSDLAQLDLQRAQTTTDYNAAIAQAEASGDYDLANALYAEKVRVDGVNRQLQAQNFQQLMQSLQFGRQLNQDALAQQNHEQARQDQLTQQAWSNSFNENQAEQSAQTARFNQLLQLLWPYAQQTGNYDLFSQLGFTPEQIAAWEEAWKRQNGMGTTAVSAPAYMPAQKETVQVPVPVMITPEMIQNDIDAQQYNIPPVTPEMRQNAIDSAQYDMPIPKASEVTPVAKGLLTDLQKEYASAEDKLNRLNREHENGGITDNDYIWLLYKLGLM